MSFQVGIFVSSRPTGRTSPAAVRWRHITMSSARTEEVKNLLHSNKDLDLQETISFYNSWAENYEQDVVLLQCRSPHMAVDLLNSTFCGRREQSRVLDVACGSGLVAKLMLEVGFRHFVGVDASQGMLELAAKTRLYQHLKLALLGAEPLPVEPGSFDVVVVAGAMDAGFIPVSVVRELHLATKPGGVVCISRGHHTNTRSHQYGEMLEAELQLMEEQRLWSRVRVQNVNRYMKTKSEEGQDDFISGSVYLYQAL